MYDITTNYQDPFAETITTFIKSEFPVLVKPHDHATLDLLTDAIIASNKVRFGPKPAPESLVAIREVISHWTAKNQPIPFLIGWGSEKPEDSKGAGVDLAELFALKTLICLNARVQSYYPPGVAFNIRVEDVSAPHLFYDRMEQARIDAARYTTGFVTLAKVIGVSNFVNVLPESSMVSEGAFNIKADAILPSMEAHVLDPDDANVRENLLGYGWKTPLERSTIGFWLERYAKLYPNKTPEQQAHILARYFAGALARVSLGITGVSKDWAGKFIELSFVQATPGIGASRALRRVYYRTMPSDITSNHMPAWRAKGYLRIGEETSAGLTSFSNTELKLNPNTITLTNGTDSQVVQADYVTL